MAETAGMAGVPAMELSRDGVRWVRREERTMVRIA